MNKYQDALNKLVGIRTDFRGGKIFMQEKINILQELVDKETPKKPLGLSICPNCQNRLYIDQKYCDKCGQKLDWSKENE